MASPLLEPLTRLWTQVLKEYRLRGKLAVFLLLLSYLGIGTLFYRHTFEKSWTYLDSVYFTMVTISTVGYGDLSPGPDRPGMQVFTVFYIIIGITIIFPQASHLPTSKPSSHCTL